MTSYKSENSYLLQFLIRSCYTSLLQLEDFFHIFYTQKTSYKSYLFIRQPTCVPQLEYLQLVPHLSRIYSTYILQVYDCQNNSCRPSIARRLFNNQKKFYNYFVVRRPYTDPRLIRIPASPWLTTYQVPYAKTSQYRTFPFDLLQIVEFIQDSHSHTTLFKSSIHKRSPTGPLW